MAEKYIGDLDAVKELEVKLQKKITAEKEKVPAVGDSDPEKDALKALRAESDDKAREAWEDRKGRTKTQVELRRWWLLAAKCKRDLEVKKSN